MNPIVTCARQELLIALRSRWTQVFAAVFAALALAVAASGYVLSGGSGLQDFSRTATSLVQLVLLLTPLSALVLGVLGLCSDRGASEILYAQPVARRSILLGRLLGLFAALGAAQALGLGAAGVVVFARSGGDGLGGYAVVLAGALAVTAVFLGLAALICAGGAARRTRSLAVALIAWFAAVVLVDVAALGVASLLPSGQASRLLIVTVLANPADAFRTGALLAVQGTAAFGAASLALLRFTGGPARAAALIALSLGLWIVVPCFFAARRLDRADIGTQS